MSAAIIPFDFETNAIRVVTIDDAPWFVAADVCRVLEHSNIRIAMKRWLDDDEKGVTVCYTPGGPQEMNLVSESGLYALAFRSRIPSAKRFRKWVTAEVLPAIRRDGRYTATVLDEDALAQRRERFLALGQKTRDDAMARADAVARIQQLIGEGIGIGKALDLVGNEIGKSRTTLNAYRRGVRMVPRDDWPVALVHGGGPHGLLRDGSHDVIQTFLDLCRSGHSVSDSYRMTLRAAAVNGWPAPPSLRSMQRFARRERSRCLTTAVPQIERAS